MTRFTPRERRQVFGQLMSGFQAAAPALPAERWTWLEAAHVVGQEDFALHLASHAAMLRFALHNRDLREAAGQLLRMALVPAGHLLRRLPAGNTGRATVSAFAPMPLHPQTSRLIAHAAAAALTPAF